MFHQTVEVFIAEPEYRRPQNALVVALGKPKVEGLDDFAFNGDGPLVLFGVVSPNRRNLSNSLNGLTQQSYQGVFD